MRPVEIGASVTWIVALCRLELGSGVSFLVRRFSGRYQYSFRCPRARGSSENRASIQLAGRRYFNDRTVKRGSRSVFRLILVRSALAGGSSAERAPGSSISNWGSGRVAGRSSFWRRWFRAPETLSGRWHWDQFSQAARCGISKIASKLTLRASGMGRNEPLAPRPGPVVRPNCRKADLVKVSEGWNFAVGGKPLSGRNQRPRFLPALPREQAGTRLERATLRFLSARRGRSRARCASPHRRWAPRSR